MHTQQEHPHLLNAQILYVHVCTFPTCTAASTQANKGIYGPHEGSHINIINLNYIGLFVYQLAPTQISQGILQWRIINS